MMWKQNIGSLRKYATLPNTKPLLLDILPPKKIISRLLFDNDARYNFHKYLPVIESIYDNPIIDNKQISEKFNGTDLLIFQRVLAQIRKQTHTINPILLKLESDLIEYAAERGSRDALCTLSFLALDDSGQGWSESDKITAKKYIKQLMEMEHPLAFKLAADRELKDFTNSIESSEKSISDLTPNSDLLFSNISSSPKQLSRAISLYNHFLDLDSTSTIAAAAHRSLGMIYFRTQELIKAEDHFKHAIHLAPSSDNSQAHFFLGLLNEIDPIKARYHFQMAASEGFRESFANLGYLELNIFNELIKAKEWFKLGAELGVSECIVGLFDVAIREKNWDNAKIILDKAEKQGLSDLLYEVREETVQNVLNKTIKQSNETTSESNNTVNNTTSSNSRWDL
jgi:protein MSS2